jgi:two-component system response regulator AlgR
MSLKVLLVDDEPLARLRMRSLLAECNDPQSQVEAELGHGAAALEWLATNACDLALLDIHMPGMDGLALARTIKSLPEPPALVFVTAYNEHAVEAFDLEVVDYLTKPVRRERLVQTLQKAQRWLLVRREQQASGVGDVLLIQDRGRTERVPLADILYLKAELKYLTVRTAAKTHIYDGSLSDLETRYPQRFVRVHRNALVSRDAVRAIEKAPVGEDGDAEGWQVSLHGLEERLAVSRRQLSALRETLASR